MGSDRDHFHSLRLGEIEDFHSICRNYPVVKVRPDPEGTDLPPATTEVEPSSSDPLVGGLPHMAEGHGSGVRYPGHGPGVMDWVLNSGMGPDLFDLRGAGARAVCGGDEETRTPDPLLAKEMLYQLSYVPAPGVGNGGRFWTRTRDLCLIRAVL